MPSTQSQIDNAVNEVVNAYTGQSISYYGTYQNQCTVPVAYYVEKIIGQRAPSMYGARADGWGVQFPSELANYFTHESFQLGRAYPRGTILIWNSPPESHIAIVLHSDGSNTVQVFEQNADPDGSACGTKSRTVNNQWHTCTYALVPIIAEPAPAGPPFDIDANFDPRQVQSKPDAPTTKWGLNYDNLPAMQANPVGELAPNSIVTATTLVHHHTGNDYYKTSPEDPDGYNVLDFHDYTVPPPVYNPPTGAITVPVTMQTIKLVTTVMTWPSATDAANRTKAASTIAPGDYQVLKTGMNQMLYVTKLNDEAHRKFWINPADNTLEKPTPIVDKQVEDQAANAWKKVTPLNDKNKPEQFVMLKSYEVSDLANPKNPVHSFHQYFEGVYIWGTFVKDGITYAALHRHDDPAWVQRYAIPWKNEDGTDTGIIEAYQVLYSPETDVTTRRAYKALTLHDREVIAVTKIEKYISPAVKFIDGIIKKPKSGKK